jgi:anion-transporting  ArsA/GET3 family ATPase
VVVVSGKGGTGKSTVAAAFATAVAATGLRVLLVEVEGRGEVAHTLGVADAAFDEHPTGHPNLSVLSVTAREALLEYLHDHGGMDRLTRPLLRSSTVEQVLAAAPGFRDLMACGKLFEVVVLRRRGASDRPRHDLVVVDGPPTGQIAAFLRAPEAVAQLVRGGRVRRQAESIAAFLRTHAHVLLVAAPEEMAVAETAEAAADLASKGFVVAAVAANRVLSPVIGPGLAKASSSVHAERLGTLASDAGLVLTHEEATTVRTAAQVHEARRRTQRPFVRELGVGRPPGEPLTLPDVAEPSARQRTAHLANVMLGAGEEAAIPAHRGRPADQERAPEGPAGRLLDHLQGARVVVVCGSGGVGKTTISAAIAVRLAEEGRRTVLLTVDPARRLATALRLPSAAGDRTTVRLGGGRTMEAIQLDTQRTFDELIRRHAGSPQREQRILANPFYRRLADTLAGTSEYMAMEKLYELAEEEDHDAIVIDTPPTRSALSFLDAPKHLTDFLGGRFLRWMLSPGVRAGRLGLAATRLGMRAFARTVGRVLGGEVIGDAAEFLQAFEGMYAGFKERAGRVVQLLGSSEARFVVVTSPSPTSLTEGGYFLRRLDEGGMRAAATVVNRFPADTIVLDPARAARAVRTLAEAPDVERRTVAAMLLHHLRWQPVRQAQMRSLRRFGEAHPDLPLIEVPELAGDVHDVAGLRRVGSYLFDADTSNGND